MLRHESAQPRANQDPYEYRKLSTKTTIRLIKVCEEIVNGCIACRMYHFDEQQRGNVKYHALSYVWGDPTPTRQVYMQDQGTDWNTFPLHENLWQFLDHAWRHKRFEQLFWTDRLCLDQNSHEEISQQVPRMRDIYRSAELVEVWLKLGIKEQEDMAELVRWSQGLKLIPEGCQHAMRSRMSLSADNIYSKTMEHCYWRRIWIVQEVVVAKKVCVTFEDISIDLDELPVLLRLFPTDRTPMPTDGPAFWELVDMRAEGGKLPLWRILTDFSDYESSRPSDRVYGLLGLVADHRDGSSPLDHIQVDYDKPTVHVILDAVFESSSRLLLYDHAAHSLGHRDTCENLRLLEGYILCSKTTQKHRQLAKLALQTLEAFEIIISVPGGRELWERGYKTEYFDVSFLSDMWGPTFAQNAAVVGMQIANGNTAELDAVKAHRKRRGETASPWRCTAHQSRNGGHETLGSDEVLAGTARVRLDRERVVNECAQRSSNCDGSTMTFEISEIGLRMLVEIPVEDGFEGCLKLFLMKVES